MFKQGKSVEIKGLPHLARLGHPTTEGAQSKSHDYTWPKAAAESIRTVINMPIPCPGIYTFYS
jgi:hypothetical protein